MDFAPVKFDRRGGGAGGVGGVGGVGGGARGGGVRPTTAAGTSLDRLVRDIKQKVSFTHTNTCFQRIFTTIS